MSSWFDLNSSNAFSAGKSAAERRRLSSYLAYESYSRSTEALYTSMDISPYFGLRWQMDIADLGGKSSFNVPTAEKNLDCMP
jgi:hypothetical protein